MVKDGKKNEIEKLLNPFNHEVATLSLYKLSCLRLRFIRPELIPVFVA